MANLLLVASFVLLATLCRAAEVVEPTSDSCAIRGQPGSYSYNPNSGIGPEQWGEIEGFELCGTGEIQSPINFPTRTNFGPLSEGPQPNIGTGVFDFGGSTFNWALNCADPPNCGYTMFGGKQFNVINVHFHAPSEHTLNGKRFPLESHFVHQSEDGSLAVIATMYEFEKINSYGSVVHAKGKVDYKTSTYFGDILDNVNSGATSFPINNGDIIDASRGYCVYTGSLTTPPCSEGVTFLMAMNIETVSMRQVFNYSISAGASFDGNARPIQPRNGREVTCYIQ